MGCPADIQKTSRLSPCPPPQWNGTVGINVAIEWDDTIGYIVRDKSIPAAPPGGMKMPHWMLITLFTAGTSLGVALGSLMCCSPIRARRLIAWWSRADEWSAPRPEAGSRGWELEMRLAGLGLAVMFGFML